MSGKTFFIVEADCNTDAVTLLILAALDSVFRTVYLKNLSHACKKMRTDKKKCYIYHDEAHCLPISNRFTRFLLLEMSPQNAESLSYSKSEKNTSIP